MERIRPEEADSPLKYYSHPVVAGRIWRYLGYEGTDAPSLVDTRSENIKKIVEGVKAEYIALSSEEIQRQKVDRSPARTEKPWNIPSVVRRDQEIELHQANWQKDAPGQEHLPLGERKPIRTFMLIDVEHFHRTYHGKVLTDQKEVFELLEPAYKGLTEKLEQYGINHMVVMTGRGYHFITQVPYTSGVMDKLINVGRFTDRSLYDVQSTEPTLPFWSKRDRAVPPNAQKAHKGASLLGHFLVSECIDEISGSSSIPVKVSDIGEEGISIDLTTGLLRSVHNGCFGTLGSIYIKHKLKRDYFGPDIARNTNIIRIPRAENFKELGDLDMLIHTRQNYGSSIDLLQSCSGDIPDGSSGFNKLIRDYEKSNIKKLHDVLNKETDFPPSKYGWEFNNYGEIAGNDGWIADALYNANPKMLEPESLDHVLRDLFYRWGGHRDIRMADKVRSFLRSVYEDSRFQWGSRFYRHYGAEQHATGWTEIILGQEFGKKR